MKISLVPASLLLALALAPGLACAAAPEIVLAQAPDRSHDQQALQRGARTFISYCLGCHPASLMRFNRLGELGFTDEQISKEFLLGSRRIGDPMTSTMTRSDANKWFGIAPPDLSVIARARTSRLGPGEDWLYTYLRGFYRDPARPSGWNNVVFQNVAMHHVLWEFQGRMSPQEYDGMVADLVGYLVYMSEPTAQSRRRIGWYVLGGAMVLLFFAFAVRPPPRKLRRREPA